MEKGGLCNGSGLRALNSGCMSAEMFKSFLPPDASLVSAAGLHYFQDNPSDYRVVKMAYHFVVPTVNPPTHRPLSLRVRFSAFEQAPWICRRQELLM